MLRQLDMGGGNATNHALFAEETDLRGLMQIYGQIGNHHTAPTAGQRWMEVTTMRLIDADELRDTIEN